MMKKIPTSAALIAITFIIVIIGAKMLTTEKNGVSADLTELQTTVKMTVPAKAIKWEIFGTPEDTGGLGLGPTDYMTLVAELEPADPQWFARQSGTLAKVWIAPESARPWLSDYFRALLVRSNADMTGRKNCKPFETQMTTSGRVVNGFTCEHEGKLLMHVMLLAPSL